MKIKQSRKLTLPELIKWVWENDIRNAVFEGDDDARVSFDQTGDFRIIRRPYVRSDDLFGVIETIEVTQDTVLDLALETYRCRKSHPDRLFSDTRRGVRIREILQSNEGCEVDTLTIHLVNDDGTMTLLWMNGMMVE